MRGLILAGLFVLTAVAGCASPPREEGLSNVVHAARDDRGDVFDPGSITVRSGGSVRWDVVGPGHHTVTFATPPSGAGEAPDSGDLGPDETFEVRFDRPGTYPYWCRYHSDGKTGMTGAVVVQSNG